MPLLQLILILVIIGVLMWAINTYAPLTDGWKKLINIVVMVIVVFWLLGVFGLLGPIDAVRVGG